MKESGARGTVMLDIRISSLKVFVDVVRLQSFSEAARQNGVTQSAVSQIVQLLESRLGTDLIVRSRPLKATSAGERFCGFCSELVDRFQQATKTSH